MKRIYLTFTYDELLMLIQNKKYEITLLQMTSTEVETYTNTVLYQIQIPNEVVIMQYTISWTQFWKLVFRYNDMCLYSSVHPLK